MTCTCQHPSEILLYFSASTRDGGTHSEPEFRIPEHVSQPFDVSLYKCYVEILRFHVQSFVTDTDETYILKLTSHNQIHTYDTITKAPSQVIAVQGQSQVPGVYSTMRTPLPPIQISSSPIGTTLKFHIATVNLSTNNTVTYTDCIPSRDAYWVMRCSFKEH